MVGVSARRHFVGKTSEFTPFLNVLGVGGPLNDYLLLIIPMVQVDDLIPKG